MRRLAVTCAALASLVGGIAAARGADAPTVGLPAAKLVACDMTGSDRSATFAGRMDAIPGGARMAMRFVLFEKLGKDGTWQKLDVPSLRQWHRATPGVRTFAYKQTVDNLRTGGAYKARIAFRWMTAAGIGVDTEVRDTGVCRGALPNLAIGGLDMRPGPTDDTRTYRITVDNDGKGEADGVDVVLSVDRAVLDTVTIDQLNAGDSKVVSFVGPPCSRALRVRLDPSNTVGELDEDDNSQLFACP
jgi:hypothetical protein